MFEPVFILSTLICDISIEGRRLFVHDKILQNFTCLINEYLYSRTGPEST